MHWNSKVIWSEGMLLQPQHLQQHDRYLQNQLESRVAQLRPYGWGFSSLVLDETQLAFGKIALLSFTAVLPDGTPVQCPLDGALPLPIDIPSKARNVNVVLALPLKRPGIVEAGENPQQENYARHKVEEHEAWDSNGLDNSALMQVGQLRLRLALESEVLQGYSAMAVAHVIERGADNRLLLDADFCPPCMDIRAASRLTSAVQELVGLLKQRGQTLAQRLSQPGASGAEEIVQYLFLQVMNREQALFSHLSTMHGLHPEDLFRELLRLAGELATFGRADKLTPIYPNYLHDQLRTSFLPVIEDVRRSLSVVMDAQAISIRLEERQFGLRVAVLQEPDLVQHARFVLAVNADLPSELIRSSFPPKVKISAIEKIRDMVNLQLPGIGLRPLPVAPPQLPFHAGYTYFELDRQSEYWKPLLSSAGFAMHVAGDFPGLKLEFWAIREKDPA